MALSLEIGSKLYFHLALVNSPMRKVETSPENGLLQVIHLVGGSSRIQDWDF